MILDVFYRFIKFSWGNKKNNTSYLGLLVFQNPLLIYYFFQEKIHRKKYFSLKPLIETAVETADAPDIGKILILFATHSLINIAPGSETRGGSCVRN